MSAQTPSPSFHPATDVIQFRTALGRFSTGVTVITAASADGPIGITANSFASISLSPALIMWAPNKASARHHLFVSADAFVIHVLSATQRHVCDAFVRSKSAFEDIPYTLNKDGIPVIANALAVFECQRFKTYEAGDHTMILGEVHTAHEQAGEPLIFANGVFTSLRDPAPKI